ncbi:hypothetical protein H105_01021, partial [Trichophyton soudanense CBS 452.61]
THEDDGEREARRPPAHQQRRVDLHPRLGPGGPGVQLGGEAGVHVHREERGEQSRRPRLRAAGYDPGPSQRVTGCSVSAVVVVVVDAAVYTEYIRMYMYVISGRNSLTPESINTRQEASSPGPQRIDTQAGFAAEQSRIRGKLATEAKESSEARSFMHSSRAVVALGATPRYGLLRALLRRWLRVVSFSAQNHTWNLTYWRYRA